MQAVDTDASASDPEHACVRLSWKTPRCTRALPSVLQTNGLRGSEENGSEDPDK
jgi:hypothetical protein